MSSRMRGWLALAVAVTLAAGLLVLAGPMPGPEGGDTALVAGRPAPAQSLATATHSDPARTTAVDELLDRRAKAVLNRSESEFMATVDLQADPAFITAQRALLHNLGGVPLSHWSYQLDTTSGYEVPPQRRAGDYWAPRTQLHYALDGADTEPTTRELGYLYVRRDGRWFVSSDTALESAGGRTWRGPWDFGPCRVLATNHGLVLGHPAGGDQLLADFAAELDGAVASVTQVWGTGWSQRVAVLVPQDLAEMRAVVGPEFNVDGIAAAAVADKVDVANETAIGQRIVLNPTLIGRLSPTARRIVLRHEITHIAARSTTVDGAPMWLLEGFADYVGYRDSGLLPREAAPDLVRSLRAGVPPTGLPVAADFTGGTENLDLAYQLAWSAALYVVDLVGEPGLVKLYRMIAADQEQNESTVSEAMTTVLGVDLNTFVAGWLQSLPVRFG